MNLSNNSIVLLSDIGEGSAALNCTTQNTTCCTNSGAWLAPDGSFIGGGNTGNTGNTGVYRTRGLGSLSLNRRNSAMGPTGVYTCKIWDRGTILRTLYVGVYSADTGGEFHMQITRPNCIPQVHSLHHCSIIIHYVL